MTERLIDRQLELLDYLTSDAAIFGAADDAGMRGALKGVDPRLLKLEARFSHEKRMEKIAAVFPRTFRMLGDELDLIVHRFVREAPPREISRLANACEFYGVLCAIWDRRPPQPPYLPDVAAVELAFARAHQPETEDSRCDQQASSPSVRRHRGVILLRCGYDIRALFEGEAAGEAPLRRDTRLAVTLAGDGDQPSVCEIEASLFDLIDALDEWTDPAVLNSLPRHVVDDLIRHALLEVRR